MESHWEIVNSGMTVVSSSPEGLWQSACGYFAWCDSNPIKVKGTVKNGKEAGRTYVEEHPRPYTIKGLCLHCGISEEWIRDMRQTKDKESLYYIVISKILYVVYVQIAEYATVGVFNPIFSSKMLNMEKDDIPTSSVKVEVVTGLPELAENENDILEKLELENPDILKAN